MASKGRPVYGVNTGFGELASVRVSDDRLRLLQRNIVRSHACGVGDPLDPAEARGLFFLRANELARGYSGVRPEVPALMAAVLNAGMAPVIPRRGSVGASGDLAPQAHAALVLIGEGSVFWRGRRLPASRALRTAKLRPLRLDLKEGLSLINGTQGMQAVGGLALRGGLRVAECAQIAGAMSLEAIKGTPEPFDRVLQELKPHRGQVLAAASLRGLLADSQIRESHRSRDRRVQDPYSFRCMPQVHGAALDAFALARETLETEMASVTDNPILSGGRILSGGNFHGQQLALFMDMAAVALATLAGISERRIFQLVSGGHPGLKPFLAADPGVESGWMLAQVCAAALVSELKGLAHPASADSIPTSANKEDFVSMGMGAALKLKRAVWTCAQVVGIELLAGAQAVESHRPLKPGRGVRAALDLIRAKVPRTKGDEILGPKLEAARDLVLDGYLEEVLR